MFPGIRDAVLIEPVLDFLFEIAARDRVEFAWRLDPSFGFELELGYNALLLVRKIRLTERVLR